MRWLLLLALASACQDARTEGGSEDTLTARPVPIEPTPAPGKVAGETWYVDYSTGGERWRRGAGLARTEKMPWALAASVNRYFAGKASGGVAPRLKIVGRTADTLLVQIEHAEVLTQQMGSTGARELLGVATYTLTESPGVQRVRFDFPEGDHAAPGVYGREDF
ncbi:MAG: hypothetical protein WBA12_06230 [Catalinimonas sp.]